LREAIEFARDDEIAISRLIESQVKVPQRLVSERSYTEAQMVLTEVLRREPGNTAAAELIGKLDDQVRFAEWKQAGVAALEQGQYQRALELLSRASEANPRDEEVETLAQKARMTLLQGGPVVASGGGAAEYTRENPEVWQMVKRASDYLLKRDSPSHGAGGEALIALTLYKAGIETSNVKVQAGIQVARKWASSSAGD
jgi:tetratricopeptide (TPR) repeat protein